MYQRRWEICEKRDRKGLYKLARRGKIKAFTGIFNPYEIPEEPELSLNTENTSVDNCAQKIILKLQNMGIINFGILHLTILFLFQSFE